MKKNYSNRQMKTDTDAPQKEQKEFFFPKHNPPVTIKATSKKEAEEKLQALDKNNQV